MKGKVPKSHLLTREDLPLVQLNHTFMLSSVWLAEGMEGKIATFDLFVRDMPANRSFMIAGGLEEVLDSLVKLRFSKSDVAHLLDSGLINQQFAKYLTKFRFTGNVEALPEGTVFFPYEPIIKVTAPIIEASLIEVLIMSLVTTHVMFLSKAARLQLASQGKFKLGTGPLRAHSLEAGTKAARAAHICGFRSFGMPVVFKKYGLETKKKHVINAQHLFVTSFASELESFRTMVKHNPDNSTLMVDTYDFKQGVANAIEVGLELKARGHHLHAIHIDSGDPIARARYTRRELDRAGLTDVTITLAGNLDEGVIERLAKENVPCDLAVSVTEYVSLCDSPKLEIVYKLAEVREGKKVHYAAKLTSGKLSYPGRKQVFRQFKKGRMVGDVITLETEKAIGQPLLKPMMKNGRIVAKLPGIEEIKNYTLNQLKLLPKNLLDLHSTRKYPVKTSPKILKLLAEIKKQHQ